MRLRVGAVGAEPGAEGYPPALRVRAAEVPSALALGRIAEEHGAVLRMSRVWQVAQGAADLLRGQDRHVGNVSSSETGGWLPGVLARKTAPRDKHALGLSGSPDEAQLLDRGKRTARCWKGELPCSGCRGC